MNNSPVLEAGKLYLVATPIGNLNDITARGLEVLRSVDLIAAENTRHSIHLLNHYGIETRMQSFNEHNESENLAALIERIKSGENVAIISDAGTPLISDPGHRLVSAAHDAGIQVIPLPGPCAAISALAASGLSADAFSFFGFLPAKAAARRSRLTNLQQHPHTMIFFEAPHRLVTSLSAMCSVFGDNRLVTLAREISKRFETIKRARLIELCQWVDSDPNQTRGEIVLVVEGYRNKPGEQHVDTEDQRRLSLLREHLPPNKSAAILSKMTGKPRKLYYDWLSNGE